MACSRALPPLKALAFSYAEWVEVKALIRYVVPPAPMLGTDRQCCKHPSCLHCALLFPHMEVSFSGSFYGALVPSCAGDMIVS